MTDPSIPSLSPSTWVQKRDGRLVPFEADKISRALFAASERLGHPDAFMTRELTDGILHFLTLESTGGTLATSQIAELVVKVVRELGQPKLAREFAAGGRRKKETPPLIVHASPPTSDEKRRQAMPVDRWISSIAHPSDVAAQSARACLADYSKREVFSRDLIAAHTEGLLAIRGLATPLELAGYVLPAAGLGGNGWRLEIGQVFEALDKVRAIAGELVALDGPEYLLARFHTAEGAVGEFTRALTLGLRLTGLHAVLNLNCAAPPPWAEGLADGPLFAQQVRSTDNEQLAILVDALLEQFKPDPSLRRSVRLDVHLGSRDFDSDSPGRLLRFVRCALDDLPVAFVFDRPATTVELADGLDRKHPAALMSVGLNLPRFAEHLGSRCNPSVFLDKLGSLGRLALSAATQKREFLRRHSRNRPEMTRGFLLERALLIAIPIGLPAVTRTVVGQDICSSHAGIDFAKRVVEQLRNVLHADGQTYQLETRLGSGFEHRFWEDLNDHEDGIASSTSDATAGVVAGLTTWDSTAPAKNQIKVAGALHGISESGTAAVLFPKEALLTSEMLAALLRQAWENTSIVRLQFVRSQAPERQMTAPWAKT
jgi:hypothetical protein